MAGAPGHPLRWELLVGDIVVATLVPGPFDDRYHDCGFEPTVAFDAYRPLFAREQHALEAGRTTGDHDHWAREYELAWQEIRASGLRLRIDGRDVDTWIMHIDDDRARVRYVAPT